MEPEPSLEQPIEPPWLQEAESSLIMSLPDDEKPDVQKKFESQRRQQQEEQEQARRRVAAWQRVMQRAAAAAGDAALPDKGQSIEPAASVPPHHEVTAVSGLHQPSRESLGIAEPRPMPNSSDAATRSEQQLSSYASAKETTQSHSPPPGQPRLVVSGIPNATSTGDVRTPGISRSASMGDKPQDLPAPVPPPPISLWWWIVHLGLLLCVLSFLLTGSATLLLELLSGTRAALAVVGALSACVLPYHVKLAPAQWAGVGVLALACMLPLLGMASSALGSEVATRVSARLWRFTSAWLLLGALLSQVVHGLSVESRRASIHSEHGRLFAQSEGVATYLMRTAWVAAGLCVVGAALADWWAQAQAPVASD